MIDKTLESLLKYEKERGKNLFELFFPQINLTDNIPEDIITKMNIFLKVGADPKLLNRVGTPVKSVLILSENKTKIREILFELNGKENYVIVYEENKELETFKAMCSMIGAHLIIYTNKEIKNDVSDVYSGSKNNKLSALRDSDIIYYDKALLSGSFFKTKGFEGKIIKEV